MITEYSRGFVCGMKAACDALQSAIDKECLDGSSIALKLLTILKLSTQMASEQINKSEKGPIQ